MTYTAEFRIFDTGIFSQDHKVLQISIAHTPHIELIKNVFNPNPTEGGGNISPPVFQKIIALEPNVELTSNQAVNSSLSVVLRSKKNLPIRTRLRGGLFSGPN